MSVISLERAFPLTIGANIGTTTTGLLAALASEGSKLGYSLQLALCHFFFNISGILIWYPIPFMRKVPINAAKALGNTTAKYRWFAVVYLITCFFIVPAIILGLSYAHIWAMGAFLILVGSIAIFVTVVKLLQNKKPSVLPPVLKNWKFLPLFLRSLSPYDKVFTACFRHCSCCNNKCINDKDSSKPNAKGHTNNAYDNDDYSKTKF